MEIINISKEEFANMLFNPSPLYIGRFGIITLNNNKLYKIYYKDFIDAFMTRDPNKIDILTDFYLSTKSLIRSKLQDPTNTLNLFKELEKTKSNNLITGILSYRGIVVGVEMNYFENYITLAETTKHITSEKLDEYLNKAYDLVSDLISHNILPSDIKEDNILVNLETNDLVLIDLDGLQTAYGSDNPYTKEGIFRNLNEMKKRLKKEYDKSEEQPKKKRLIKTSN